MVIPNITYYDNEWLSASFRCDIVYIEQDQKKVMELQKGHGDWDPRVTGVSQSHFIYCLHNMGSKSVLCIGST